MTPTPDSDQEGVSDERLALWLRVLKGYRHGHSVVADVEELTSVISELQCRRSSPPPASPSTGEVGENGFASPREAPQVLLLPCPFCGEGTTDIDVRRLSPTMKGPGAIISVTLRHHCRREPGQPTGLNVSMHGRDEASARAAWNRRAPQKVTAGDPRGEANPSSHSLIAEVEKLREALREIANAKNTSGAGGLMLKDIARSALKAYENRSVEETGGR